LTVHDFGPIYLQLESVQLLFGGEGGWALIDIVHVNIPNFARSERTLEKDIANI
jgi:hypothetical protein